MKKTIGLGIGLYCILLFTFLGNADAQVFSRYWDGNLVDLEGNRIFPGGCSGKIVPTFKHPNTPPFCLYRTDYFLGGQNAQTQPLKDRPYVQPTNGPYSDIGNNQCGGGRAWDPQNNSGAQFVKYSYTQFAQGEIGPFDLCPTEIPAGSLEAWAVIPPGLDLNCQYVPQEATVQCNYTNLYDFGNVSVVIDPGPGASGISFSDPQPDLISEGERIFSFPISYVPVGREYAIAISGSLSDSFVADGTGEPYTGMGYPDGDSFSSAMYFANSLPILLPVNPVQMPRLSIEEENLADSRRQFNVRLNWTNQVGDAITTADYLFIRIFEGSTEINRLPEKWDTKPIGDINEVLIKNVSFKSLADLNPALDFYGIQPRAPMGNDAPLVVIPMPEILPAPPQGVNCLTPKGYSVDCTMDTLRYTDQNDIKEWTFEVQGPLHIPNAEPFEVTAQGANHSISVTEPGVYLIRALYVESHNGVRSDALDPSLPVTYVWFPISLDSPPALQSVGWAQDPNSDQYDLHVSINKDTINDAIWSIRVLDEEGVQVAEFNRGNDFEVSNPAVFSAYHRFGNRCFQVKGYGYPPFEELITPDESCETIGQNFFLGINQAIAETSLQNHTITWRYTFNLPATADFYANYSVEYFVEATDTGTVAVPFYWEGAPGENLLGELNYPANHLSDGEIEIRIRHWLTPTASNPQTNREIIQGIESYGRVYMGHIPGDINSDGFANDLDKSQYAAFLSGATGAENLLCPEAMDLDQNGLIAWREGEGDNLVSTFNECGEASTTVEGDLFQFSADESTRTHPNFLVLPPVQGQACHYYKPDLNENLIEFINWPYWTNVAIPCEHGPNVPTPWVPLEPRPPEILMGQESLGWNPAELNHLLKLISEGFVDADGMRDYTVFGEFEEIPPEEIENPGPIGTTGPKSCGGSSRTMPSFSLERCWVNNLQ